MYFGHIPSSQLKSQFLLLLDVKFNVVISKTLGLVQAVNFIECKAPVPGFLQNFMDLCLKFVELHAKDSGLIFCEIRVVHLAFDFKVVQFPLASVVPKIVTEQFYDFLRSVKSSKAD